MSGEHVNDPFEGPWREMQRFTDTHSELCVTWVLE